MFSSSNASLEKALAGFFILSLLVACGGEKSADGTPANAKLLAAVQTTTAITPQSGWWWNPAEGGRGFALEVQNGSMFMAGYLYDASGRASWYAAGPTAMTGSTFNSTLTSYKGGQTLTGTYHSVTSTLDSGSVSIVFTDASHGTMTWPGGTVAIERYDFGPGGASAAQPVGTPEAGWWWNAAEGGRGYSIEVQNGALFIAGYMYDNAGNPIWYASSPTTTDGKTYTGKWQQYGNGQTLTGTYKSAAVVNANVGNITVTFSGPRTATLTLPNGQVIALARYDFGGSYIGDCFQRTAGVQYSNTKDYDYVLVAEEFEGIPTIAQVEVRGFGGTRFGAFYSTISGGFYRYLGSIDYDGQGNYDSKIVNSGWQIPANMTLNQTVIVNYTSTRTDTYPVAKVSTSVGTDEIKFLGFEDLTIAGRQFTNACKFSQPGSDGTTSVSWSAKGFGTIRYEDQNAQGITLPGTRTEIKTIVNVPAT